MVTIEYRCADGTPFPVTFEDEAAAARTWGYDRAHVSGPVAPLHAGLARRNRGAGLRAYEEIGMPVPPGWGAGPGPTALGFEFFLMEEPSPEQLAPMFEAGAKVLAEHGSATALWKKYCLPRVLDVCEVLRNAPADAPLDHLFEEQSYGFQLTMVPMVIAGNDMRLLETVVTPLFEGKEGALVANELVQGHPSETLRADQQFWELGRRARGIPEVASALDSHDAKAAMAALRATGAAPEFFAALDDFLAEFGVRAEEWTFATPTWAEEGPGFWAQLRSAAASDRPSPQETLDAAAARREALVVDVDARLDDDAEARARFHRRLQRLDGYVDVREERAHWQLALHGLLRGALLRRGEALVAAGVIDRADDVMVLEPEELESATEGGVHWRDLVASRRTDYERWSKLIPPGRIGGVGSEPEADTPVSSEPAAPNTLTGNAVSRGVATGTARVITSLEDAHRLAAGEVLVCVMTSPPWTSLFGLAAALVSDAGGMGSHPAIAAREYGIPAVLGTVTATHAIPDGATVTVDGLAGTVTW